MSDDKKPARGRTADMMAMSRMVLGRGLQGGMLPHEILLSIARGERQIERVVNPLTKQVIETDVYPMLEMRMAAANMAAPYYAPKLAQIRHRVGEADDPAKLSDERLLEIAGISAAEIDASDDPMDEGDE